MADVEQNLAVWESWDWSQQGDEWSASWGGTPALWHGALLPRIHSFVPTGTILEIAPGYGRWTQYLKDLCERLLVVDLARQVGADVLVKGLRVASDFEFELQMAQMNEAISGIQTVFVPCASSQSFISSSLIRDIARLGGADRVSSMVPEPVAARLKEKFA